LGEGPCDSECRFAELALDFSKPKGEEKASWGGARQNLRLKYSEVEGTDSPSS
jgi:hypothetical protein